MKEIWSIALANCSEITARILYALLLCLLFIVPSFLCRVAVQNERYDDWSSTLIQLRRLFMDYQRLVLEYHKRPGVDIPKAVNSTAAQGNFLEVLNMSLNGTLLISLHNSFNLVCQRY